MSDENWRDALPEPLKPLAEAPWLKDASSIESAVEQLQNASSRLGNSITLPGQHADDATMGAFYEKLQSHVPGLMRTPDAADAESLAATMRKLGTPEKAEDYSVTGIEGAPEGEVLGNLKAQAHALNWTQAQFQAFVSNEVANHSAMQTEMQASLDAGWGELRGELGAAFDKRVAAAAQVMKEDGWPEAAIESLQNGTMPADQARCHMATADRLGAGDSGSQGGMQGKGGGDDMALDPDTARVRVQEIMRKQFDPNTSAAEKALLARERLKLTALYAPADG